MAENSHSSTATHTIVEQESENEETEEIEDKDCKYVNKGRNTTNMRLYLENHHKEEMEKLQDYEKTAAGNKSKKPSGMSRSSGGLFDFFNKPSNSSKPRVKNPYPQKILAYKTFKEDLTRLAGCTSFPLSKVDSSHFHALLFHANSRIADCPPSRNTLKKWVVDYSTKVKKNVIVSLRAAKNFFVTMDIWSQPGLKKIYLGIVAVFYNPKSSKIEVAALACRDFPHPHNGLRIRQLFEQIFVEYDLDVKKVIRFTTDKGANVVNALHIGVE
ncbi:Uncharacterized protein APZ42_019155 [Daphnia magna]|uniref:DUF659 domain-containing protein n=1 Tax=Daphnia magna TaxID=35525 RepID=A0A164YJ74_9CRUS|nr:Uncharacterized protein APZ42_019155 [Daphnia magna]